MRKISELENKWFRYKVKKIIIPAIKVSSLYLLAVGAYYVYDKELIFDISNKSTYLTNVLGVSVENNASTKDNMLVTSTVPVPPVIKPTIVEKVEVVSLAPIIPIIDREKEERIKHTKKVYVPKKISQKTANKTIKAKPNTYLTSNELSSIKKVKRVEEVQVRKTKKINFNMSSSNYIETMKNKFKKSKNPREALLLSKAFYADGKYDEAEKWALSANKLDSKLDESWLLFAKSKAKLGKKNEAIKILVSYYKKSHSSSAKQLIGKIKTGQI